MPRLSKSQRRLNLLSVCLPVSLTLSVSYVSLCRSVSFYLSCSLSHYCCTNVSPEWCDGSVITREFPPCRLFPLPPLLTSPQAGNDLPWPRARSGVMSQLVPDLWLSLFSLGFLATPLDIFLIKLLVLIIAHCGRTLS